MKPSLPVLFFLILCVFAVGYSSAATLTVTKVEDTNDGVCDADCSLREAVAAAASGDTVVFSSLFSSPQTITLTLGQIPIDKNLTITGTGQDLLTVSGNNASRIFNISGNLNVVMSGMKLRDGRVGADLSDARGGAIRVLTGSGDLDLSNMEFTNNRAFYEPMNFGLGAALYCLECTMKLSNLNVHQNPGPAGSIHADHGNVVMRDSVVSDNNFGVTAYFALTMLNTIVTRNVVGGITAEYLNVTDSRIMNNGRGITSGDAASTLMIENCTIAGNTDVGVSNVGLATIRKTIISNNQYSDSGAGISTGGTMYVIDSAIIGNSAARHGGGVATYGRLFITNSTVSGNVANGGISTQGLGGGVYVYGTNGRLMITNSTVSNNRSSGKGGGVRQDNGQPSVIRNTIIAGNTTTLTGEIDVSGVFVSEGINLIGNTTGSSGWLAVDLLNINPFFAPLGNNGVGTLTHALLPGSPAIDAGNSSLAIDPQTMQPLTQDQRGFARITGGKVSTVDIGAYEAFYSSTPVTVSGRITTYSGRGIDRTRIVLDDGHGDIRYAQTNPFGYYRFFNLLPGTTYTITVTHKLFLFTSPQFFTADQNRSDLNFITGL